MSHTLKDVEKFLELTDPKDILASSKLLYKESPLKQFYFVCRCMLRITSEHTVPDPKVLKVLCGRVQELYSLINKLEEGEREGKLSKESESIYRQALPDAILDSMVSFSFKNLILKSVLKAKCDVDVLFEWNREEDKVKKANPGSDIDTDEERKPTLSEGNIFVERNPVQGLIKKIENRPEYHFLPRLEIEVSKENIDAISGKKLAMAVMQTKVVKGVEEKGKELVRRGTLLFEDDIDQLIKHKIRWVSVFDDEIGDLSRARRILSGMLQEGAAELNHSEGISSATTLIESLEEHLVAKHAHNIYEIGFYLSFYFLYEACQERNIEKYTALFLSHPKLKWILLPDELIIFTAMNTSYFKGAREFAEKKGLMNYYFLKYIEYFSNRGRGAEVSNAVKEFLEISAS